MMTWTKIGFIHWMNKKGYKHITGLIPTQKYYMKFIVSP